MPDLKTSDYEIRLTGSASIPEKLELGEDITVGLTLNTNKIEITNNEDGTSTETFKCKPVGDILITKKWGKTPIKGRLKNSPQSKYHWACRQYHNESGIETEFSEWYPIFIDRQIAELLEK